MKTLIEILENIAYKVTYKGQIKLDEWDCDAWVFNLNGILFDYHTGIGHRAKPTIYSKRLAASEFPGLTQNDLVRKTSYGRRYLARVETLRKPVEPPIQGLLYAILLDSEAGTQSFASWCSDLGYDTDSRKALRTYEACQENYDKLCKLFTSAQIADLKVLLEDY